MRTIFVLAGLYLVFLAMPAAAQHDKQSLLGRGVAPTDLRPVQTCLHGEPRFFKRSYQDLRYDLAADWRQQFDRNWGRLGASVNFFLIGGGVSIEYLGETARSDRSLSLLFSFQNQVGSLTLQAPQLTPWAETLAQTASADLRLRCGDHFIHKIDLGARLWLAVTLHFNSKASLERFVKTIKISFLFGLISKTKRFVDETKDFAEKFRMKVSGLQFGGEPQRLAALLARQPTDGCDASNRQQCLDLLDDILAYVSDKDRFAAQLSLDDLPKQELLQRFHILQLHYASYENSGFMQWPAATLQAAPKRMPRWDQSLDRLMRLYKVRFRLQMDQADGRGTSAVNASRLQELAMWIETYETLLKDCFQMASQTACQDLDLRNAAELPEYIAND